MAICVVLSQLREMAEANGLSPENAWFTCDDKQVVEADLGPDGNPANYSLSRRVRHQMPWPLYTLKELEEIAREKLPDSPPDEVLFYSQFNLSKPGYEVMLFAHKFVGTERKIS